MNSNQNFKMAIILFFALAACYLSLSPGSIAGQGYTGEEIDSGLRMLSITTAWLKGRPVPPMIWTRHGPVPVLFDLPFLKVGKHLVSPEFMLSFEPVLLTAASVSILFLWLRKLYAPGMSLFLSLTAAFGTMFWPYAYIGLETKQSFFVLLAGYLALADGKIRTWPRFVVFAVACALAMSVKSTGVTLLPAILYLVYVQFREDWRARPLKIGVLVVIVAVIGTLAFVGRSFFWTPRGGGANALRPWLTLSPLQIFSNAVGVFGSPTKGLLVYAPVLIACLYAVPRAFRLHRDLVIYSLLVTVCTLGLISLLTSPSDEVWGCRYMHVAIAPLILCIGSAWPRFCWRKQAPIVILALVGVAVSFLGAFYYYGVRDFAMRDASQNTMEWIAGDSVWNAVEFNAKLFQVWLSDSSKVPVLWTPKHVWVWSAPPDATPWKTINLHDYCQPQSFMIRFWHAPKSGVVLRIFMTYLCSLILGVLLLVLLALLSIKEQYADDTKQLMLNGIELGATTR
jgi:hypothetical protein